ncbi:hypothetical protein P5G51_018275 [Virgibacillus sp. 179-BFC.A HS]|uniref:Uncharacterized protein n=1 Tax=Tigheibacillus jepli TaxID=3035914 RepID=A0ABU5CKY9_9BACI|nr:hypothetical protein [Virgibacillus sp. 179-BFC.A HS]MDY0407027.1 hypothetical protein [Virgibacillus sp. 179-BFC.A HS]
MTVDTRDILMGFLLGLVLSGFISDLFAWFLLGLSTEMAYQLPFSLGFCRVWALRRLICYLFTGFLPGLGTEYAQ